MKPFGKLLAAAAILIFAAGSALAGPERGRRGPEAASHQNTTVTEQRSSAGQNQAAYDPSGTRGRMGLGADTAYPEGPGNFSF